jgi:hypothetical protein
MKTHNNKRLPKVSDVDITKLSLYELCRWTALEEAVNLIGEKCEERNIDFETVELKPLDILKYVDNATDIIYEKISTT